MRELEAAGIESKAWHQVVLQLEKRGLVISDATNHTLLRAIELWGARLHVLYSTAPHHAKKALKEAIEAYTDHLED